MKYHQLFSLLIIIFFVYSCKDNSDKQTNIDFKSENEGTILQNTSEVFKSFPSPIETALLIKETGAHFNSEILNPVKNAPYYETSKSMALNLGVYCADISFSSLYNQREITLQYLKAIKILAEGLGIIEIMQKEDILKLEDNLYNQDTIKYIIKDIFFSSGKYLNDNNRPEIALLVEVGAWTEALYIAMQSATQSVHVNKELVDRISMQKASLELVIKSLKPHLDLAQINQVYLQMKTLENIYNKISAPQTNGNKKLAPNLASQDSMRVTPEIFLSLFNKVNEIRNSFTQ